MPEEKQFREGRFILATIFTAMWSVMAGREECERAGPTVSSVEKQRENSTGAQVSSSF